MRERRQRKDVFVDLGDLRRALAVYNVDRSVEIKLPDGRRFAVADVRLDRDSGEPVEDATVLLIAGAGESRPKEELEQTRVKELAVAARVCVNKGSLRSTLALVYVINSEGDVAPYFVAPFEVVGGDKTVERAIFDKIRGAGLFGDQDERDVRVHYWKTNVERKSLVESCPASLRILGVIH